MTAQTSEFVVRDVEDGVIVVDSNGDEIAKFLGDYAYNVAFLAFVEGMRASPDVSVWIESRAQYLLQGGQVCDERLISAMEAVNSLRAVAMKTI